MSKDSIRSMMLTPHTSSDLDTLIAGDIRDAYTSAHGETITPSSTGKE